MQKKKKKNSQRGVLIKISNRFSWENLSLCHFQWALRRQKANQVITCLCGPLFAWIYQWHACSNRWKRSTHISLTASIILGVLLLQWMRFVHCNDLFCSSSNSTETCSSYWSCMLRLSPCKWTQKIQERERESNCVSGACLLKMMAPSNALIIGRKLLQDFRSSSRQEHRLLKLTSASILSDMCRGSK